MHTYNTYLIFRMEDEKLSSQQSHYEINKPLLYITQPKSDPISVNNMQKTFILKPQEMISQVTEQETIEPLVTDEEKLEEQETDLQEETIEDNGTVETDKDIEDYSEENIEVITEPTVEEIVEVNEEAEVNTEVEELEGQVTIDEIEETPTYSRKSFKEMTNLEKIDYLVHKPFYIPKIVCEISTNDNVYIGVIGDFDGEKVKIILENNIAPVSLHFEEINQIKMKSS